VTTNADHNGSSVYHFAEEKSTSEQYSNYTVRQLSGAILLYAIVVVVVFAVGGLAWGPWAEHQCSTIIMNLPAPLQAVNGKVVKIPHLLYNVTHGTISVSLLIWTSLRLPVIGLALLAPAWVVWFSPFAAASRQQYSRLQLAYQALLEAAATVSGLLTSWGLTNLLTTVTKVVVHRRRPNFYSLCKFDWETLQCTSTPHHICGAHYSFVSGHSSLSAAAMVFLSCYIVGKILHASSSYRRRTRIFWSVLICSTLCSWAVYVATTRVLDHWHHVTDVSAGLLVGAATARAVYCSYFQKNGQLRAPWTMLQPSNYDYSKHEQHVQEKNDFDSDDVDTDEESDASSYV